MTSVSPALNAPAPFIKLRPEATKARRADSIALTEELISELRSIRPESPADTDAVFASIPSIEEFRQDLEAAGIAKEVAGRGRIDFHSLRHTAATLLAEQNIPQRLAMQHMRLTDPRLLDHVYTDHTALNMTGVVDKLPRLLPPVPQTLGATGTEDVVAGSEEPQKRVAKRVANSVRDCPASSEMVSDPTDSETQNRPGLPGDPLRLSPSVPQGPDRGKNSAGRTRTYNQPVNSRLLYH